MKYEYRFRPGYNSDSLMLEFSINDDLNKQFIIDFLETIKEIEPKLTSSEDLWMNDTLIHIFESNLGQFEISIDIWGGIFISSEENQNCLNKINKILESNDNFIKIEVNYEDYKTTKKEIEKKEIEYSLFDKLLILLKLK